MHTERFQYSCQNVPLLAIFIMQTGDGTHTGILHRDGATLRILDLCWHECLRSDLCNSNKYACVIPDLEPEEINDVTAFCRLIDQRHRQRETNGGFTIPYSFRHSTNSCFSSVTGELMLGDGFGLSCSTFVMTVFQSAKVTLVDLTDWQARPEDEARHLSLLQRMRDGIPGSAAPAQLEHIEKVRTELRCFRVRPEEVAGSALAIALPVNFELAEQSGRWILDRLPPNQ